MASSQDPLHSLPPIRETAALPILDTSYPSDHAPSPSTPSTAGASAKKRRTSTTGLQSVDPLPADRGRHPDRGLETTVGMTSCVLAPHVLADLPAAVVR